MHLFRSSQISTLARYITNGYVKDTVRSPVIGTLRNWSVLDSADKFWAADFPDLHAVAHRCGRAAMAKPFREPGSAIRTDKASKNS